ncbi:MAG: surface lipoprotein assembly modifier [Immundisolibacterales bacterium]|nr:surface lipoprotein assembly modifier [Immundisolibacterales bacterium]
MSGQHCRKRRLVIPGVLAVAAALVLAGPAKGQQPPSSQTPAAAGQTGPAGVDRARSLIREGRFLEALKVLRPVVERHPHQPDALFLVGLAGIEASGQPGVSDEVRDALLDAAIEALHAMLVQDPSLVRARLEMARAFFLKGKDSLARRHFEQVLAGDLPPAVVANVQRFLIRIRARKRWSVYFGAALAPDSNIGAASDERFIQIHVGGVPLSFRRDQEELTTSGLGLSLWTGGEYQHPLGERVRLRAGGDLSRREYAAARYDQTNLGLHAGPRWLVGARTDLSVLGSARRSLVHGSADYDALGGRFEARRRLTRRLSVTGHASWHDRRYRVNRNLDGPVRDLSLSGNWVATPTVRVDGALGYGAERPAFVRNRNTSRWVRVGVRKSLPKGFSLGASAQLRWTDYEGEWIPHTPPGEFREDRTRTLSASVHHRRFTLYGFSPELAVTSEARDTNAQLHDYRRNSAELRFVRQF